MESQEGILVKNVPKIDLKAVDGGTAWARSGYVYEALLGMTGDNSAGNKYNKTHLEAHS